MCVCTAIFFWSGDSQGAFKILVNLISLHHQFDRMLLYSKKCKEKENLPKDLNQDKTSISNVVQENNENSKNLKY